MPPWPSGWASAPAPCAATSTGSARCSRSSVSGWAKGIHAAGLARRRLSLAAWEQLALDAESAGASRGLVLHVLPGGGVAEGVEEVDGHGVGDEGSAGGVFVAGLPDGFTGDAAVGVCAAGDDRGGVAMVE